jgi:16S rRNA A1518/A1519 N6-dimethyltransferase RsmA/KsgA/DIM1 with predicted DNA glycosylase/AP lyase activity
MEFYKIMEVERTSFFPEPRVTSVMVRIKKKENNILQDTFRRREMTLKNAIRNAVINIDKKTKRQSKESLSEISEDIKKFWDKQVKSLNFEEIETVIANLK